MTVSPTHAPCPRPQPNEYIIGQMMLWGLSYNQELSTALRNASTLPWFRNTVRQGLTRRRVGNAREHRS